MTKKYYGIISMIKDEGKREAIEEGRKIGRKIGIEKGRKEGEKNMILRLLENNDFEEVARLLDIEPSELSKKLN